MLEKKGPSAPGGGGNTRPDDDDDFLDDDDEDERRHWKARNGGGKPLATATMNGVGLGSRSSSEATMQHHPQMASQRTDRRNWEQDHGQQRGRQHQPRNASYSDEARSSNSRSPIRHHTESHRVPYFRYFGPTAIVPGFKQMVVSVRDRRRSTGGSFSATSPSSMLGSHPRDLAIQPLIESDTGNVEEMPVYDLNDPAPVHTLILNLVKTFFHHLGCNYPFLKEAKFIRMVREKRVEPILVDAVCALAARFSELPTFTDGTKLSRAEYGHIFAQRAKSATVDTFPCPTVGAVQACLLMAYEGFGANQDSALWMYLGLAIRMAVDLGLQKMVGVKYQGEKDPWYTRHWGRKGGDGESPENKQDPDGECLSMKEQREVEQERIDTFWAVFVLDRVISSGTGRPVTFRDDDFELALPEQVMDTISGRPDPFPTFIQIIHLYGRVSDVLNNIRNAKDLTQDKWDKLAKMENDLTKLYQKQDQRLHFNVSNFKAYLKAGQGTTFILLHFWFHALIIILHQPTLLSPFGTLSRTHQLLPNSRELSMSSAKTIADILAFAELIDPKSFIGNPFTSQPMYIAACAFLMESVANASQPASRDITPPLEPRFEAARMTPLKHGLSMGDLKSSAKHSLLASAANQNYQRCYNSLQQLNTYWGGVKYILTALDQKSKGIWDCETYTHEEYESTKAMRRGSIGRFPRFENPASPNVPPIAWSLTGTTNSPNSSLTLMYQHIASGGPQMPPSSQPQPHLVSQSHSGPVSAPTPPGNMIYDPIRQSLPDPTAMFPPAYPQPNTSAIRHSPVPRQNKVHRLSTSSISSNTPKSIHRYDSLPTEDVSTPPSAMDQGPKLHMLSTPVTHQPHNTFTPSSQHSSGYEPSIMPSASPASTLADPPPPQHHGGGTNGNPNNGGSIGHGHGGDYGDGGYTHGLSAAGATYSYLGQGMGPITDVITFDSQEIDIGALGLRNEMMPGWFEYLPEDVLGLLGTGAMGGGG